MARSHSVFIAYNHFHELLGAWTVKHELKTYAKEALALHREYQVDYVVRVPDGMGAGCEKYLAVDVTDSIKVVYE